MGKGDRPGVLGALRRSLSVGRVPGRSEPLRVWHYTSQQSAIDIERDCELLPGSWGTDGPGVYVTDVAPIVDRLSISMTIWVRWRPVSMEAFIGLPFIAGEMEPSQRHAHVWVVKKSELRLTGLEDLEVGLWEGTDPSAEADAGSWLRRPLRGCR